MHSQPRDRSLAIKLSGLAVLMCGVVFGLLGMLQAAVLLLGLAPVEAGPATLATGVLAYAMIGGAFGCVGLGALRLRRWALPTMLTLAWTWLLLGLSTLVLMWSMLDALLELSVATDSMPAGALQIVKSVAWLVTLLGGVALPACIVWIFRSPDVRRTFERHDRLPSWTDRCPPPVLGLAIALAACGAVAIPTALKPAVPVFGQVWSGAGGSLLTLAGAAFCVWLARELFLLRRSGWWGSFVFLTLVGISSGWTLWWGDSQRLLVAAGYPEEFTPPGSFALLGTLLSVGITVATWLYMLRLRPYFEREATQDSATQTPSR